MHALIFLECTRSKYYTIQERPAYNRSKDTYLRNQAVLGSENDNDEVQLNFNNVTQNI